MIFFYFKLFINAKLKCMHNIIFLSKINYVG